MFTLERLYVSICGFDAIRVPVHMATRACFVSWRQPHMCWWKMTCNTPATTTVCCWATEGTCLKAGSSISRDTTCSACTFRLRTLLWFERGPGQAYKAQARRKAAHQLAAMLYSEYTLLGQHGYASQNCSSYRAVRVIDEFLRVGRQPAHRARVVSMRHASRHEAKECGMPTDISLYTHYLASMDKLLKIRSS